MNGDLHSVDPELSEAAVLAARHLSIAFRNGSSMVEVVNDVSLSVRQGESLGLVGESGSGKTVTSLALLNMLPSSGRITAGSVMLDGRDLLSMTARELSQIRGRTVAMISQEPRRALNPAFTVGQQLTERARVHLGVGRSEARSLALELLDRVRIPRAVDRFNDYPHQFSGGMCQRVCIALALVARPRVLLADEPTTALDVTVQAEILDLLHELRSDFGLSMVFITHDLAVISEMCDRVAVMYAGQVVEHVTVDRLFAAPRHPYSIGLIASVQAPDAKTKGFNSIPGMVPSPADWPTGCRFFDRCSSASDLCEQPVSLVRLGDEHEARCVKVRADVTPI